jgi:serine-type D-Ala-D-Ala carboxypeptidase (penicillin-binding protein 5/6)
MRRVLRLATATAVICASSVTAAEVAALPSAQAESAAYAAPGAHAPGALHALASAPTGIVAAEGELINARSGRRLWSLGRFGSRPIASITKVMTAIVIIRAGHLGRKITVPQAAVNYAIDNDAGSAGLYAGDTLTTWQLLEGLLLPSGADAAYTLAQAYGPGWPAFVRKMNTMARKLGMTETHFANFDGLPWPTEYSTYSSPRDVIRMGEYAMRLWAFRVIVRQRQHWLRATRSHHAYYWTNKNLLLDSYRGAIGIKTGFTYGAGYCLLFAARRDGRELMGVVLDSTVTDPSMRFTVAARLLNWGFAVLRRDAQHAARPLRPG